LKNKISIIIPTFNRAHLISETLDSILVQTYNNWECLVIDDGSTDNTKEILNDYIKNDSRFQYHLRLKNLPKGANACRNYGFELSQGEFINWFDSDDIMHPEKLELQLKLLLDSDAYMSVSQCVDFEGAIDNIKGLKNKFIYKNDNLNSFIQNKMKIFTPAPLIRKQFLLSHNLVFNNNLKRSQEFEFFSKILLINPTYVYTNKVLTYVRKHNESISYTKMNVDKIMSTYRSRFFLIEEHIDKLTQESINQIKKRIQSIFLLLLQKKEFTQANLILKDVRRNKKKIGLKFLFKLYLTNISFKSLGKGERILKM